MAGSSFRASSASTTVQGLSPSSSPWLLLLVVAVAVVTSWAAGCPVGSTSPLVASGEQPILPSSCSAAAAAAMWALAVVAGSSHVSSAAMSAQTPSAFVVEALAASWRLDRP